MRSLKILSFIVLFSVAIIETAQSQNKDRRAYHRVVVRKAQVRYAKLPRWGAVAKVRPANAVVIHNRRKPYYFTNGIYYAHRKGAYTIVKPRPGLRIRVLPVGYRTIVVGPRNYYYYYGTYYTKVDNSEEYNVVDPPEGAVVDALPDGYEIKAVNGTEYYFLDGVYYAEVDAPEFEDGVGYEVVKL